MSLSKLDWTNWEKPGIEAGQAFVSQQKPNHETCVSHAIGKGIFEFLLKEIRLYRGYNETELKAKQEEIISNVISKVGKITPINPVEELHGKDITQDGRKLWMEITWARRNGSTKPFADAEQRKSFLKDGSNFLIIICDTSFFQPGSDGLHAVYVDKYDERSFFCINSWGSNAHPCPEIKDSDQSIKSFNAFGVHLVDDKDHIVDDVDSGASSQPTAPAGFYSF